MSDRVCRGIAVVGLGAACVSLALVYWLWVDGENLGIGAVLWASILSALIAAIAGTVGLRYPAGKVAFMVGWVLLCLFLEATLMLLWVWSFWGGG